MDNIIKKLYETDIDSEYQEEMDLNEEFNKIRNRVNKDEEILKKYFANRTDEFAKAFWDYLDANIYYSGYTDTEAFSSGYKVATRMLFEALR